MLRIAKKSYDISREIEIHRVMKSVESSCCKKEVSVVSFQRNARGCVVVVTVDFVCRSFFALCIGRWVDLRWWNQAVQRQKEREFLVSYVFVLTCV